MQCMSLRSKSIFNLKEQFNGVTVGFQLHHRSCLFRHMTSTAYLKDSYANQITLNQTILNFIGSLGQPSQKTLWKL